MALAPKINPNSYFRRLTFLKMLFWLYFLLLIFEGSLRKWVVPELSAPLLIVRDPVALMIIWEAYRTRKWPQRWTVLVAMLTVVLVGLFTMQMVIGGNSLIIGLYGLRSYLLPFPVLFIMGDNLDEEDLRKLGACTLWLLPPMTLLAVAQYLAPPGSLLNAGAYEGGRQIGYIGGHVRSSGTFSFAIGVVHFCTLAAAFILYGLVREAFARKWMLWAGSFSLLLSIPTTGARSLLAQLGAMLVCVGIGAAMGLSQFGKVLRIIVPVAIASFLVAQLPVFSDAMRSMTERVSGANSTEGGGAEGAFIYRTIGPVLNAIERVGSSSNWLGQGLGSEASAMQALMGRTEWSDDEIDRELLEMGPIVGIGFGLFKLFLFITLLGQALARARAQEALALLMLPLVFSALFFGTPEQPTVQGFLVISAAFCIAAAKVAEPAAERVSPLLLQRQQLLYRRRMQGR